MKTDITIVLLYEHPEYLNDCAILINKQWKRSLSARIQSIERSFKDLPDSVLLLKDVDGEKRVIGHSRLTRVLEDPNGCWIGSVVIAEEERHKGYGKYLMKKTEEYAKLFNFSTVYLNTQDQQGFYEHLGYTYGETVSMIGFKVNNLLKQDAFTSLSKRTLGATQTKLEPSDKQTTNKCLVLTEENLSSPAPPPPPMPLNKAVCTDILKSNLGQYWMKKSL